MSMCTVCVMWVFVCLFLSPVVQLTCTASFLLLLMLLCKKWLCKQQGKPCFPKLSCTDNFYHYLLLCSERPAGFLHCVCACVCVFCCSRFLAWELGIFHVPLNVRFWALFPTLASKPLHHTHIPHRPPPLLALLFMLFSPFHLVSVSVVRMYVCVREVKGRS